MSEMKWGWHGLDITLDLFQRTHERGQGWSEHSHEFYEVFWIEEGNCLHILNGKKALMGKGDMVFLIPGDRHSGTAVNSDRMVHVNLSLEKSTLERIRDHYAIDNDHWPWQVKRNRTFRLTERQIQILGSLRETIDCRSRLDHDLFVLQLLKFLKDPLENSMDGLPDWLRESLRTFHNRRLYGKGVEGLAGLSGYSREYISRIVRNRLNKSTTELLRDIRFEGILHLLRHTDRKLLEIADEFGFKSTAYFYKCFKDRYNQTPAKYRTNYHSENSDKSRHL